MNISASELASLQGATIVDLSRHEGSVEIRGAVRYRPSDLLEAEHLVLPLPHDRPLVLYSEGAQDTQLAEIAEKLRANGFTDVRILEGGFAAYRAANLPTQEASQEQVVPPSRPQEQRELDRRL